MVRDVLAAGFPRAVWVCGEIQNYDRNKGKQHAFFELVEKSSGGAQDVKARVGLVIWANTRPKIETVLKRAENAFELKDDIEVKFLCRVDFYPGFGQLRLIVEDIDPVYTLGKIAQDRQKLIAELTKAGLLEKNKALPLAPVPLSIGLVTAPDSAAYHDFIDELKKSGYGFSISFIPALMQGKGCAPAVCAAIEAFDAREDIDAVVITRGGGSIAELACFDAKEIALAIAGSKHPVITGIGHEINTSIADLTAHTFAKTPTATAQFLAGRVRDFITGLDTLLQGIRSSAEDTLRGKKDLCKDAALGLQAGLRTMIASRQQDHVRAAERLRTAPARMATALRAGAGRSQELLKKTIHLRLQACAHKIGHYQKLAGLASPQNVLRRGFSLTRDARGKVLRSARALAAGEKLCTEFSDGTIASIVEQGGHDA